MSRLNFSMRPPEEAAQLKPRPRAHVVPSPVFHPWMLVSVAAVAAAVFAAVWYG